jgi:hypothetical protein
MALEIKPVKEDKAADHFLRTVDFRVGSSTSGRLLPSWDNALPLPPKIPNWWLPVAEMYAPLTLTELRQIDNDAGAQAQYIKKYLTPVAGSVGLPVLKLLVGPEDRISDGDYEYLTHLMPPPNALIGVTPLLYSYHLTPNGIVRPDFCVDQDRYLEFTRNFINRATDAGAKELALTLPPMISHTGVGKLLEAYKDVATPLAVIDSNGGTNRERYPQLKAIIGLGQKGTYNLTEKHKTKFALYGFDCKPFRGRADVVPAINALQLDNGLSSFGRRRTNRVMIKRKPGAPPPPPKPPMILFPKELAYARSSIDEAMNEMREWHRERTGIDGADQSAFKHRRAFELEKLVTVARQLSEWSRDGELDAQLAKRKVIQTDLRAIKRSNSVIFTRPLF